MGASEFVCLAGRLERREDGRGGERQSIGQSNSAPKWLEKEGRKEGTGLKMILEIHSLAKS